MEFCRLELDGDATHANLTRISVAGFAFEVEGLVNGYPPGTQLYDVRIHVGPCVLEGQAVVRSVTAIGEGGEVGCLFHPNSRESEERWMALVAGIEAVQGA